jgi:spermidine synthase
MMAHVPIFAHGAAAEVLIIGGGDGGMAREVLRHTGVRRLTQVEIDAGVVAFSREHLPSLSAGAFDDPRLDLVIADGAAFVRETDRRFDVIIIDSTDPIGPGEVLFTETFYGQAKRCLAPDGILVTQNGVPFLQADELRGTMAAFGALFRDASCYTATIPTYAGGPMAFGWGTDGGARKVDVETLTDRFQTAGIDTRYYDPQVHKAAFVLPRYISKLIE